MRTQISAATHRIWFITATSVVPYFGRPHIHGCDFTEEYRRHLWHYCCRGTQINHSSCAVYTYTRTFVTGQMAVAIPFRTVQWELGRYKVLTAYLR